MYSRISRLGIVDGFLFLCFFTFLKSLTALLFTIKSALRNIITHRGIFVMVDITLGFYAYALKLCFLSVKL